MTDSTNDIWPQWDSGDRVQAGTRVYNSKGFPGLITEVVPGRLRPVPGPYGGAYPPRVAMQFDGDPTEAGVSFEVPDKLDSRWRVKRGGTGASGGPPERSRNLLGWAGLAVGIAAIGLLLRGSSDR